MTTEERKEKYKSYLRDISRTENTVLNYTRALDERFPDKINCESLFSIIDIDYLTQISNSCHNGELEEWSSSIGNHLPRAAINKYISFLNKPLENEIIREEKNNQMNSG